MFRKDWNLSDIKVREPMQLMVLEVARAAMERRDELKREQDRLEEEQEDEERRVGKWVNHDGSPEEETLDKLYLHDTLPVAWRETGF